MTRELRSRLIFGVLIAAVVVAAVAANVRYAWPWGVIGLAILASALGSAEYARMAASSAPGFNRLPLLVANLALVSLPITCPPPLIGEAAVVILGMTLGWSLLDQMFRRGPEGIFAHVGALCLGVVYLGVPLLLLERLAAIPERGGQLLLVFIAAVKLGDVAAFFGGKALGRRKLCPSISPGKTWEGFYCSFIGAIGGSYLFAMLPTTWGSPAPFTGWWQPAVWGLVLGPLGVLGDLAESCMKRVTGMKDSGSILPGFGGMLDVLDALIIAAPAAYLLAKIL